MEKSIHSIKSIKNERNLKIMEKITMNVTDLVKEAAKNVDLSQKKVREVVDAIEATTKAYLAQANQGTTVEVKVFPGLSLIAEYVEPHEGRNPMTGETITVEGKNRCKAKIGSALKAAVNA